jgi:hypothetical protein
MKIVIDPLDKKSITAAIKQLEQYEKEFRAKEEEFVRRLKEIGISVAQTGFSLADYDGINDVLIAETQNGPRAAIIAYGQAVGFIEFGTGVKFREYNSAGLEYTPPAHGTYGKGRGKNPYGWYFKQGEGAAARHTYGNPPAEAMLTARNAMIEQVVQIAREVWK